MSNENQGGGQPEIKTSETKKVIEELQKEGYEFEGIKKSEPEPKPKEQKPDVPEEPKPPKEPEKPKDPEKPEPPPEPPKEPAKREPREEGKPAEPPAWQQKKEERRARQEERRQREEARDKMLQEIYQSLKKQDKPAGAEPAEDIEQKIDELTDKLEKGEISTKQWAKEYHKLNRVPGTPKVELPKEVQEKLAKLDEFDEIKRTAQTAKEDREYSDAFDGAASSTIREDYPHASAEDLQAIKQKLKGYYFSERYIRLSPLEIYRLKKDEFAKDITPADQHTAETGTKGVGRAGKVIDYEDLTDEQFEKLSPEEQQKVIDYKIAKEREARGVKVS